MHSCFNLTYQVVVLIGLGSSAFDISRDLVGLAKEVHVATRIEAKGIFGKHPIYHNLWLHPMVKFRLYMEHQYNSHHDKEFAYKYHFPFLDTGGEVSVDDNRVGPLYKHVFPPTLAPRISFVGLTRYVIPFFVFELQSKWIAGILSGRISIPSKEMMMEDTKALYLELEAKGVPKRYTHKIHDFKNLSSPFEYEDWLAAQCGCPPTEEWRKRMLFATIARVFKQMETYRNEWDDDNLVLEAYDDFSKIITSNP
ncbi:Flavin-containing monooxygenase FMO GS-OX-like 2 [Bienertia sinuspersici]